MSEVAALDINVSAVADAVAEATATIRPTSTTYTDTRSKTVPKGLPEGWVLKASLSNPEYYYFFFIPTGLTSWHPPIDTETATANNSNSNSNVQDPEQPQQQQQQQPPQLQELPEQLLPPPSSENDPEDADDRASKRRKTPTASSSAPKEVRVLHILKKHKGSRRPSSWRQPKITNTLEEAKEELQGLLEILVEEEGNPEDLRATFAELARTESDCSSAKRGGDLGFFGRRKMQPAFEEASFALKPGQLTNQIVETSSGAHLILRIG